MKKTKLTVFVLLLFFSNAFFCRAEEVAASANWIATRTPSVASLVGTITALDLDSPKPQIQILGPGKQRSSIYLEKTRLKIWKGVVLFRPEDLKVGMRVKVRLIHKKNKPVAKSIEIL